MNNSIPENVSDSRGTYKSASKCILSIHLVPDKEPSRLIFGHRFFHRQVNCYKELDIRASQQLYYISSLKMIKGKTGEFISMSLYRIHVLHNFDSNC